jgi:RNA polymerase sigma-70 factor (ECF subfamily)
MAESAFNDEFLALVTRCQGQLFGYLYSLLRNLDDAEDVLQEATLAMWRRFGDYDRGRSFLGWSMKFAELAAMNHLRSKRRRRVVVSEELVEQIAASVVEADSVGAWESYQAALVHCMDRLPADDRDLIRLCYFEKCSVKSLAQRLGRSSQSVCNSMRRIRKALYDCIQSARAAEEADK